MPVSSFNVRNDQGKTRLGRVASLVLAVTVDGRACPGLIARLTSQNAIADRRAMDPREFGKPPCTLAADIVVMTGFATNHAAERDIAIVTSAIDRHRNSRRYFEGAWYGDTIERRASRFQCGAGAAHQLVGDIDVETRLDDQHMRAAGHVSHYPLESVGTRRRSGHSLRGR